MGKKIPTLEIEQISEKINHGVLSLVEYKTEEFLCVIDTMTPSVVGAYVLDYADQEHVDIAEFLTFVLRWYTDKRTEYPLSVEISKNGLTSKLSALYRTFDTNCISRVVGQAFGYQEEVKTEVKRRKAHPVPEGIAIKIKK